MKKSITPFAAAALAFVVALGSPSAWAGSVASVDQFGDSNYTIVFQKKNKTLTKSWTASTPLEERISQRKINGAIKQATRYRSVRSGKMGGGCKGLGGANSAYVAQSGYGNTAFANQTGSNNVAVTDQDGANNASYIVQKGSGNEAYATQTGSGNVSVIVQRC